MNMMVIHLAMKYFQKDPEKFLNKYTDFYELLDFLSRDRYLRF